MSTLVIAGQQWSYRVGRASTVIFSPEPQRRKYVVTHPQMMGLNVERIAAERSYWKTTRSIRIDPAQVRAYVEKHLLEKTE